MKYLVWLLPVLVALGLALGTGGGTEKGAVLSFHSFDGSGPEYTCKVADPEIVSVSVGREYSRADHGEIDGAGYTVTVRVTGVKAGETILKISARSPIADNWDAVYGVTVDEDLNVTVNELERSE